MKVQGPRTPAEAEGLIAKLDALVAESGSSAMSDIQEYKNKHLRYMQLNYGRFMGQFEMYFSALVEYSHSINYLDKKGWPVNRGMQFIIATHSLRQLHSSYTLVCEGVYGDSISILRSAYESFLRIIFISLNPEHAHNVYRAPGQSGKKFNATNLIADDLGLDWTTYGIMSAFAHSNQLDVIDTLIEHAKEKPTEPISLKYKKDDDMISLITNFTNFIMCAYLLMFTELFTVDYSNHKDKEVIEKYINRLQEYADVQFKVCSTHNANEKWRVVAADLRDIIDLLKAIDVNDNTNWKEIWRSIHEA